MTISAIVATINLVSRLQGIQVNALIRLKMAVTVARAAQVQLQRGAVALWSCLFAGCYHGKDGNRRSQQAQEEREAQSDNSSMLPYLGRLFHGASPFQGKWAPTFNEHANMATDIGIVFNPGYTQTGAYFLSITPGARNRKL
jgi:hypothetical protein